MAVQKGQKRGQYKRSARKRELKEAQPDGLSYQEIGRILGISANEVKRIEKGALNKLKKPTGMNKKLYEYDCISASPVHEQI